MALEKRAGQWWADLIQRSALSLWDVLPFWGRRRCRQPADHLAIVTVESEGYTDNLTVPAGELQRVGSRADIRADRDHLAVMIAGDRRPVWRSRSNLCFF